MSIECSECERDARDGHDPSCSRYRAQIDRIDRLLSGAAISHVPRSSVLGSTQKELWVAVVPKFEPAVHCAVSAAIVAITRYDANRNHGPGTEGYCPQGHTSIEIEDAGDCWRVTLREVK